MMNSIEQKKKKKLEDESFDNTMQVENEVNQSQFLQNSSLSFNPLFAYSANSLKNFK